MSVIILTVDEVMRTLSAESSNPFVVHDKEVDIVRFAINSGFADIVLDGQVALRVMYQRPGESQVRAQTLTYYDTDGLHNYYDWQLSQSDLVKNGSLMVALCILDISGGEVSEWHTTPCQIRVLNTIHTDDSDEADESITPTVAQRVAVLETMIQRVASGAPIVVASTSAMTDTNQIYVLSTDGNWYYHNGTAWTAGGEYGAVATDTTLTQAGIPADAKVVGDKISPIKSDVISIKNVLELDGSGYVFVDSVAEMTDINTRYVLSSNGHVYEAQEVEGESPNEFGIRLLNTRISGAPSYTDVANGYFTTDYIPFTPDDYGATITIKNAAYLRDRYGSYSYGSCKVVGYDANKNNILNAQAVLGGRSEGYSYLAMLKDSDNTNDLIGSFSASPTAKTNFENACGDNLAYIAFCWVLETASKETVPDGSLSAITSEEVAEKNFGIYISTHRTTTWRFVDTGETYTEQSAIQRIDGGLRSINGQITGLATRTTALEGDVESIDTRTTALETESDDFDTRITALEEGGEGQGEEAYNIELNVGAWRDDGYTPTSDSNQLRNTLPIPLNRVSKINFGVPTGLSKVSGKAFILDGQSNLVASLPWGGNINLSALPANAVYANICISAHDSSGTGVTTISPYKDSIAENMTVISADAPVAIQAIRGKINGSIIHNSYIDDEVSTVITNLQNVQWSAPNALTLGFMTDMHYMYNVYDGVTNLIDNLVAVQMIANECSIGGLMMGGDNLAERSTRAGQILNLKDYGSKVRKINVPVFSVKGNHDDSSISGYDSSAQKFRVGYNIFDSEYYLWTEKPIANNPFVVFPPDPTGLYYYVDFPAEKVRLICLNSVDIPYIDDGNGYLIFTGQHDYGYSNAQLNWVAHTALDFSDKRDADLWGVVTMQHIIDNPNIPTFSDGLVTHNGAQMYNIFKAFKARTTYTSMSSDEYFPHNIDVDFTSATQELICRISGHSHADRQALSDDGLHISTMQAGPNSVGNNKASDGTTYTKTAGTGKESAMDFFTLDRTNKKVFCTRYGAGLSREISWV